MEKKSIGIILAGGLVLGLLFIALFPNKSSSPRQNIPAPTRSNQLPQSPTGNQNIPAPTRSNQLRQSPTGKSSLLLSEVTLTAAPASIKSSGEEKVLEKIDKSTLKISYKNSSKGDIVDLQIHLVITGGTSFNISGAKNATRDTTAIKGTRNTTFNVRSVKPGQTNTSEIYFFSKQPGTYRILAQMKPANGKIVNSDPVIITVK